MLCALNGRRRALIAGQCPRGRGREGAASRPIRPLPARTEQVAFGRRSIQLTQLKARQAGSVAKTGDVDTEQEGNTGSRERAAPDRRRAGRL